MSTHRIYKRVQFAIHFLRPYNEQYNVIPKYLTTYSKPLSLNEIKESPLFLTLTKSLKTRYFSSNLTKCNDNDSSPNDNSGDLKKTALEDEEFQNLLKDFAKDFGLGSDSSEMLSNIKKEIEDSESFSEKNDINVHLENKDGNDIIPKFKDFSEDDAITIHSFEESKPKEEPETYSYHIDQETESELPLHIKRGCFGVYDVHELVEVLHQENMFDIAVIAIPKELHYTDFLVLATAKSPRHSAAVAEYINKLYKKKKLASDPFIIVEGEKVSSWKALDMGNIVLHIFLQETRQYYDIESLWLFDAKYDSGGTLKPDPLIESIKEQMALFNSIPDPETDETKE